MPLVKSAEGERDREGAVVGNWEVEEVVKEEGDRERAIHFKLDDEKEENILFFLKN